MAINATGIVRLGGATAGTDVAKELGLGATSLITINDNVVRALAGKASGVITFDDFHGKSAGTTTSSTTLAPTTLAPTTLAPTTTTSYLSRFFETGFLEKLIPAKLLADL